MQESTVNLGQDLNNVQVACPSQDLIGLDAVGNGPEELERDLELAEEELSRTVDANQVLSDAAMDHFGIAETTAAQDSLLVGTGDQQITNQRPTMILPFVPGTSDRLRKLALQYGLGTWFSYLGHLSDLFMQY